MFWWCLAALLNSVTNIRYCDMGHNFCLWNQTILEQSKSIQIQDTHGYSLAEQIAMATSLAFRLTRSTSKIGHFVPFVHFTLLLPVLAMFLLALVALVALHPLDMVHAVHADGAGDCVKNTGATGASGASTGAMLLQRHSDVSKASSEASEASEASASDVSAVEALAEAERKYQRLVENMENMMAEVWKPVPRRSMLQVDDSEEGEEVLARPLAMFCTFL